MCLVASVESSSLQPHGLSVCGILQARILEWVAMPSSGGGLPDTGMESTPRMSPALAGRFFTTSATWEAQSSNETTVSSQVIWVSDEDPEGL